MFRSDRTDTVVNQASNKLSQTRAKNIRITILFHLPRTHRVQLGRKSAARHAVVFGTKWRLNRTYPGQSGTSFRTSQHSGPRPKRSTDGNQPTGAGWGRGLSSIQFEPLSTGLRSKAHSVDNNNNNVRRIISIWPVKVSHGKDYTLVVVKCIFFPTWSHLMKNVPE